MVHEAKGPESELLEIQHDPFPRVQLFQYCAKLYNPMATMSRCLRQRGEYIQPELISDGLRLQHQLGHHARCEERGGTFATWREPTEC